MCSTICFTRAMLTSIASMILSRKMPPLASSTILARFQNRWVQCRKCFQCYNGYTVDFSCCVLVFYESKEPDPDVIEFLKT